RPRVTGAFDQQARVRSVPVVCPPGRRAQDGLRSELGMRLARVGQSTTYLTGLRRPHAGPHHLTEQGWRKPDLGSTDLIARAHDPSALEAGDDVEREQLGETSNR